MSMRKSQSLRTQENLKLKRMYWWSMQETLFEKKKIWWKSQESEHHIEEKKYYWHINLQNSERMKICFQSQCMNIKVIETCLEEYQIMIRKIRAEFASEIQEFKKFKKLMKEKLLNAIIYVILWTKNF